MLILVEFIAVQLQHTLDTELQILKKVSVARDMVICSQVAVLQY